MVNRVETRSVSWAAGQSLSSWLKFGPSGPDNIFLPAGLQGTDLEFWTADDSADGNVDPATARKITEPDGATMTARAFVAGTTLTWLPYSLRNMGWIAFRTVTNGTGINQSAARTARVRSAFRG